VAIKVLRDAWLSPARRERFAVEQRTLAQLNHPSIARLYDAAVLPDGTPYFVMEYVDGVPLTTYCRENGCPVEQRLQLFRSVCEAAQYAHSHAIIHRDLKPSNILVKSDGGVRLLDFGIARQVESFDLQIDQTMTGLRLMTPAYAAPEQIRGDRIGIGTDVYSLGVVLYELLTNELPFDLSNLTPAEAATIITEHDPGKPSTAVRRAAPSEASELSRTAWADLDVLCLAAMHKDPRRRYASVEALIRDVDHYLQAQPLEARPDALGYRTAKFVQRNRRAVIAASLVFAVIIAMAVFFTVRLARARDAAMAEAARTQRIQQFMTNLFQGGDASAGPDDNLRVLTLLDRGVQQAQSLNTAPRIQAELYGTLGTLYENLGKFDQANSLLTAALARQQELFGPDSVQAAESLVALGLLRDDQAQLPEAERLVRQGLAIEKRQLAPNHPAIAKATTALGKVLEDRGSYAAAIQILNEAVRLQSNRGGATPERASAMYELANCHFYAGHYDTAETLNQQLLPMYRQIYGERHPRVADVLVNLAAIRHDRGRYSEAEPFERKALAIVQAWYGKDNPMTASDLTMLARTLVFEKRYDEATQLLEQSLAIKERVYGRAHPSVASSLNELGNAASLEGNYDAAERYFTRMLDIYHGIYGEHHYLVGIALSNLASAYAGKREWTRAEMLYREAISVFTQPQSAGHVNTAIARIKLGRSLLRQRRYREAEVESRAGYEILIRQMAPGATWLVSARKDLVKEYDALKQPDKAHEFRSELVALEAKSINAPIGK
jgi:serine/threonine-protein kinase